jgi:hypothetical protein
MSRTTAKATHIRRPYHAHIKQGHRDDVAMVELRSKDEKDILQSRYKNICRPNHFSHYTIYMCFAVPEDFYHDATKEYAEPMKPKISLSQKAS